MTAALKLAVFGDPVEHSLSPGIHAEFGRQLGLPLDYRRIRSSIDELPERLREFAANGGSGANLTPPLKNAGIRVCQRIDPAARQARAVNTLKRCNEGWSGHNTDGPGLLADLDRLGLAVAQRRVLIVGAGGATAGLLGPLLDRQPTEILLLNRTVERAVELAERFAHRGPIRAAGLDDEGEAEDFDLLLQATSIGHQGQLPPIRLKWLARQATVYDLNYGPAHQPLAIWAKAHDLPCHDGLGMLVGQAALAFAIWTGQKPDIGKALEALSSLP